LVLPSLGVGDLSVERADAGLKLSFAVFTFAEGTGLVLP